MTLLVESQKQTNKQIPKTTTKNSPMALAYIPNIPLSETSPAATHLCVWTLF